MFRLLVFVALGIALYIGLRRLMPHGSISGKQWWIAVAVVMLVLAYVRSPIDLIPDGAPIGFLDDLLIATGAYVWLRRRLGLEQPPPGREQRQKAKRAAPESSLDPYAVLGISPGASRDEISRAYRAQMKRYHPDRVDDLGEELRRVAHEKTLEIQRAYEELRRAKRASPS